MVGFSDYSAVVVRQIPGLRLAQCRPVKTAIKRAGAKSDEAVLTLLWLRCSSTTPTAALGLERSPLRLKIVERGRMMIRQRFATPGGLPASSPAPDVAVDIVPVAHPTNWVPWSRLRSP